MDDSRFDRLAMALSTIDTRRGLLRLLAALPVVSLPLALIGAEDALAKGQRYPHRGVHRQQVGADKKKKKKCAQAGQTTSKKRKRCCPGLVKTGNVCTRPGPPPSPPSPPSPPCNGLKPTNTSPTQGLQEAINAANNGDTLTLCPATWNLTATLNVNKAVKLVGAGAGKTILRGADGADINVLDVNSSGPVTLEGLSVTNGQAINAPGSSPQGGGMITGSGGGNATLNGVEVFGNLAEGEGGGIYHIGPATLTLGPGTTVHQNQAPNGAGIYVQFGTLNLLAGSSVTGNVGNSGGGIVNNGGTVTLNNGSTVSKNGATTNGGGIYQLNASTTTLAGGSRLTGNSSPFGGGIYIHDGTVTMEKDSRVSGNNAGKDGGAAFFSRTLLASSVTIEPGALICSNSPLDPPSQCSGAHTGDCPQPASGVCPSSAVASAQRRRGSVGAEKRRRANSHASGKAHRRHGRKR